MTVSNLHLDALWIDNSQVCIFQNYMYMYFVQYVYIPAHMTNQLQ